MVLLRDGLTVASAVIKPEPRKGTERLDYIEREIMGRLDECPPELVALEGYNLGAARFGKTNVIFQIGEVGGVVRLGLQRRGLSFVEIPPATWRKQLCGKGNLAKDQVRVELWKRYEMSFDSLDVLEAWAVAMSAWRTLLGLDRPAPKSRRRSLAAAVA
jgi:Holliday junction resolvasome RuvABC endonuclease subunit